MARRLNVSLSLWERARVRTARLLPLPCSSTRRASWSPPRERSRGEGAVSANSPSSKRAPCVPLSPFPAWRTVLWVAVRAATPRVAWPADATRVTIERTVTLMKHLSATASEVRQILVWENSFHSLSEDQQPLCVALHRHYGPMHEDELADIVSRQNIPRDPPWSPLAKGGRGARGPCRST